MLTSMRVSKASLHEKSDHFAPIMCVTKHYTLPAEHFKTANWVLNAKLKLLNFKHLLSTQS